MNIRLLSGLLLLLCVISVVYIFWSVIVSLTSLSNRPAKEADLDHDQHHSNNNRNLDRFSTPPIWNQDLKQKLKCNNKNYQVRYYKRGSFWVLENHVQASHGNIECHESITYTTHADYSFLENVIPLVRRWQAPISVALYAPDKDYESTMTSITYLRRCLRNPEDKLLIEKFVSFHLYFDTEFMPKQIFHSLDDVPVDCAATVIPGTPFRTERKLIYPVNVGRNIAREAALTHFILPSDIELYPSDNLVNDFLSMIAKEEVSKLKSRRIFPLAIFEVAETVQNPHDKTELIQMLKTGEAIRFHKIICSYCHSVPKSDEWENTPLAPEMEVFTITKRTGAFKTWEPIFIGTQMEPMYEERLNWEGKSDKMTQGYILCVMDYEFALLNNPFLTHRPGFKSLAEAKRVELETKTRTLIAKKLLPELILLYGKRNGCHV